MTDAELVVELSTALSRYTTDQREAIMAYFELLKTTRKTGKVALSVLIKELEYWAKYPPDLIHQAIHIHLKKHRTKREAYTRGILRGLAREQEVAAGGQATQGDSARGSYGQGRLKHLYCNCRDGKLPI